MSWLAQPPASCRSSAALCHIVAALWGTGEAEGFGPRKALALQSGVGITRDPARVLRDGDWRAGLVPRYAVPR